MTSKELMLQTLEFRNKDQRVPRDLWTLPWADDHFPQMMSKLKNDFTWDLMDVPAVLKTPTISKGDAYEVGEYVDDWGCVFTNIHKGVIGEVKHPLVEDEDWKDVSRVHFPEEWLSFDIAQVNDFCDRNQDKFLKAGCCPRPFEQMQFIRGTVNLYMDLMDPSEGMIEFMKRMHDFYCRLMEKWAKTDVDAMMMMDDWGSQNDLLIHPDLWDEYFKPMYNDYIQIAHSHGKKMFMHSDGHIIRIIPKLIDMGLDALNSQIFAWVLKIWSSLPERSPSGVRLTDSICLALIQHLRRWMKRLKRFTVHSGETAAASHSANLVPAAIRTMYTVSMKNGCS